jgi:hypothetical protein
MFFPVKFSGGPVFSFGGTTRYARRVRARVRPLAGPDKPQHTAGTRSKRRAKDRRIAIIELSATIVHSLRYLRYYNYLR